MESLLFPIGITVLASAFENKRVLGTLVGLWAGTVVYSTVKTCENKLLKYLKYNENKEEQKLDENNKKCDENIENEQANENIDNKQADENKNKQISKEYIYTFVLACFGAIPGYYISAEPIETLRFLRGAEIGLKITIIMALISHFFGFCTSFNTKKLLNIVSLGLLHDALCGAITGTLIVGGLKMLQYLKF
jgi:hypothetical protein